MSQLRALIVEDELLVAMNLESMLEELGYEVVGPYPTLGEASDADDQVDVAVLDVNLRGELVFPLAERLRDRCVPVVFCTAYAETGVFPESLAALPRISKPYTPDALRVAVAGALAAAAA